jgi:hypothetical protein
MSTTKLARKNFFSACSFRAKSLVAVVSTAFVSSSVSAADLVTYDPVAKTIAYDTADLIASIMQAFTAGMSLMLVFLPNH